MRTLRTEYTRMRGKGHTSAHCDSQGGTEAAGCVFRKILRPAYFLASGRADRGGDCFQKKRRHLESSFPFLSSVINGYDLTLLKATLA